MLLLLIFLILLGMVIGLSDFKQNWMKRSPINKIIKITVFKKNKKTKKNIK